MKPRGDRPAAAELLTRYAGTRVAVFGGAGFIGRWVARALTRLGAQLCVVVRDVRGAGPVLAAWEVDAEMIALDMRDPDAVGEVLRSWRPSVTFNLAGYGVDPAQRDMETAFAINGRLVQSLAAALASQRDERWPGQDFVHVGSALEYGRTGGRLTERSTPNPDTLYGRSKLAGTEALLHCRRASSLKAVAARLFTVFGPGELECRLIPTLIRAAGHEAEIPLTAGEQRRDFTYVEDVAEGLVRLGASGEHPAPIVNLATGRLLQVRDAVTIAADLLGIAHNRLGFGALPTRPEEMAIEAVSVRRLRHWIGWVPPTTCAEGVQKTLAFQSTSGSPVWAASD